MLDRELLARALRLAGRPRALLGITGPPGAGKSTLAEALCREVAARGVTVALVGMDGFHLAHRVLVERGLAEVKGAPHTFDAAGYVALLRRLRSPAVAHRPGTDAPAHDTAASTGRDTAVSASESTAAGTDEGTVWVPEFRREIEDAVAGAVPVPADTTLVVTEGNYLLLDGPWAPVRALLDEIWFLDPTPEVRHQRLAARHRAFGRTPEQAWERTVGSDERNAALILRGRERSDLIITPEAVDPGTR